MAQSASEADQVPLVVPDPPRVDPVPSKVDAGLAAIQDAMSYLIGSLGAQPLPNRQNISVDDLPQWLEATALTARNIISSLPQPAAKSTETSPEETSEDQWKVAISKKSGKVLGVLPENALAERWFNEEANEEIVSKQALSSYDSAVARCKEYVKGIIKECERTNQKFRDKDFNLEYHYTSLYGLDADLDAFVPVPQGYTQARKIFPKPALFVDGATAGDVRQGFGGDCWFLAGIAALTNMDDGLKHNYVHVDGDEKVGVYGFVFHRDGEWIYEVVDDFLFLKNPLQGHLYKDNGYDPDKPNYRSGKNDEGCFEWQMLVRMGEENYHKTFLQGGDALYFSQSRDENELWLPLLEKAYAKAHGDYQAINGGFTGEAIEDLTGGVTTEIRVEDILDIDRLWEEIKQCNRQFIFGCWTIEWPNEAKFSQGLCSSHAYSIMKAVELDIDGKPERLVLVRNPWGNSEWTGAWSDGSKEWTAELMIKLGHKFGNDGMFYMTYQDLLRKFELFDRTRLIGPEWSCAQCWTNLVVPRQTRYHDTKFSFTMDKDDTVAISLSQLDDRYIRGLEGPYTFTIEFRLEKETEKDGKVELMARSSTSICTSRSVNAELKLEAGSYSLYVKVRASKHTGQDDIRTAAKKYLKENTFKLIQIAKKYNFAHMKQGVGDKDDRDFQPLVAEGEKKIDAKAITDAQPTENDSRGDAYSLNNSPPSPRDAPLPSIDVPVENPVTEVPKTDDATEVKPDKSIENWDAVATVGLRLFTRKAMIKLSVVGRPGKTKDKALEPIVVITGESGPLGNLPPVDAPPTPVVKSASEASTAFGPGSALASESRKNSMKLQIEKVPENTASSSTAPKPDEAKIEATRLDEKISETANGVISVANDSNAESKGAEAKTEEASKDVEPSSAEAKIEEPAVPKDDPKSDSSQDGQPTPQQTPPAEADNSKTDAITNTQELAISPVPAPVVDVPAVQPLDPGSSGAPQRFRAHS